MENNNNWYPQVDLTEISSPVVAGEILCRCRGLDENAPYVEYDPYLMNDMDKAVDIIVNTINDQDKPVILICGDYDADGICATSILIKGLSAVYLKNNVKYHIPNRLKDGYGLSEETATRIVSNLAENKIKLVITCDNGITCHSAINILKNAGITVIVTDHHQVPDSLPNADAVINCHRKDNTYPFDDLCGAGVAFKLVTALFARLNFTYPDLKNLEDMAMLATMADSVPLVDENRTIVHKALSRFMDKSSLISAAYCEISKKNQVTSTDISFDIVPKINAAGRLGDISPAMGFMLSDKIQGVKFYYSKLEEMNSTRKALCEQMKQQAAKMIKDENLLEEDVPLVLCNSEWSVGLVGILAIHLATEYKRPAFVFSKGEDGKLHGSARTYGDFDIYKSMEYCSEYIDFYGGHPGAGGLTVSEENFEEYKATLYDYYWSQPCQEGNTSLYADALINISMVTPEFYNEIMKMEPFGEENKEFLFMSNATVTDIKYMGEKAHIKFDVIDNEGHSMTCVGFNKGEQFGKILHPGDKVTVVYTVNKNEWNNKVSIQAYLEDVIPENTTIITT